MRSGPFRVAQPWGSDKARQSTTVSEHASAEEAFAAIDAMSARFVESTARSDAVELIVLDDQDGIVPLRRVISHPF